MFNKIKQFKELRDQAKRLQDVLREEKVTVEKGGVTLVMNGNQEVESLSIDSSLLSADRKADVEKHIREAFSTALDKVKRIMAQKMQSMGGLEQFGLGK